MNRAILRIAPQDENGGLSKEVRIVLNHERSLDPSHELVEKNIIRSEFSKAVPRYLHFAAPHEQAHFAKRFAH